MSFPEPPRRRTILRAVLPAAVGLIAAGCSRQPYQTAEVTGTITAGGKPVPGILVMFAPPGGSARGLPSAYGVTDATGRYRAMRPKRKPGAVVGHTEVRLSLADGDFDRPRGISMARLARQQRLFEVRSAANVFDISLDE